MKNSALAFTSLTIITLLLSACGGDEEKSNDSAPADNKPAAALDPKTDPGIGPIKSLTLPATIDQGMAKTGAALFVAKCSACHKPTEKFIGPAPKGVLERRNPVWVMNMILNPMEMIMKNPTAKQLLMDNNMAMMADQNLKEEEARAILEYFRTL